MKDLYNLNQKLADFFKAHGISHFRLISYGNSLASGYSIAKTIPFLSRNETIETVMDKNGIEYEHFNFARAQNNNDEHLYEWLINNVSESSICQANRFDYGDTPIRMLTYSPMGKNELELYYPCKNEDLGLQDLVSASSDSMANIIIYNGCTGSFLDVITRNGNFFIRPLAGFKRDITSLEAILKFIQTNNRFKKSKTQIYICGLPDYLGLKVTEIINQKIRKSILKYANAVYVPPIKASLLYKFTGNDTQKSKHYLDVHFSENEYLELHQQIIQAICNNYNITDALIKVDRELVALSTYLEFSDKEYTSETIIRFIAQTIFDCCSSLSVLENREFLKRLKPYILERLPFDFYYLGKKNVTEAIKRS